MASAFPARSTSMPSRPHPLPVGIEEELNKLKTHVPSSSSSAEAMLGTLEGLGNLYASIEHLLHLPLCRKAVAHLRKEERSIEEMLDGYVRLLDACNTIRDTLLLTKEGAQRVQSALRRRGVDVAVAREVDAYLQLRKKTKKDVDKCLSFLNLKDGRCSSLVLDMDANISTIVRAIGEANAVSISILRSFLFFVSSRRSTEEMKKKKNSKWSLVSRAILKGAARNKGVADEQMVGEFEGVDAMVYTFHRNLQGKEVTAEFKNVAQKRLESLHICIETLEDSIQSMFRKIIQNRVSFLNILSM